MSKHILIIGEFSVFHRGYADFLVKMAEDKSHKFFIGILGDNLIKDLTALEPDIRKVSQEDAERIINSFLSAEKYFIVEKDNFLDIIKEIKPEKIIILKGDKSEIFAEKYLGALRPASPELQRGEQAQGDKNIVEYFDIRLRWQESKVQEFKKEASDIPQGELVEYKKFMLEAQAEAEKSKCWWRQVGAVAVKDGKVIYRSFNNMLPSEDECYKIGCIRDSIAPGKSPEICSVTHAEATIISMAANEGVSLKDSTLYVTHFPCPACAKLVALAGFKKLVYMRGSSVFDGERVMASRGVDIIKI